MQEQESSATVDDLLALISGMVDDDELTIHEFAKLDRWLATNRQLAELWPATEIVESLRQICADNIVDRQELELLCGALKRIAKSRTDD